METVIKPKKRLAIDWQELRHYRELFYFFAWRDIKVRYKQTAIGAAWAIFQPFITMVVFTIFFNKVGKIGSGSIPYAIFSYTGLLFWNFFSRSLDQSSNSLVNNQGVITKIYFPRLIPPISSTIVGLVDFFFALIIFIVLMAWFRIVPGIMGLIMFLPAILLTFVAAAGGGLFLSALNVKYRDVKAALPFLIQIMLFVTPVIYPVTAIPQKYQWILYLNPMTGVIQAMRSGLIHEGVLVWSYFLISVASSLAIFSFGLVYFRAKEKEFADII